MRFLPRSIIAALVVAAVSLAHAEESDAQKYALHKLLDASVPVAQRQTIFDRYKEKALAGNAGAQYVVGSLYRIGAKLDANVVDTDIESARKYLSVAATHGRILAMAKMAEMELAAKHPMEAMIWAQLYGHYKSEFEPGNSSNGSGGYLSDLLHRVQEVFDDKQTPQMKDYFGGFIATHDAEIRAGQADTQVGLDADDRGQKIQSRVQNLHYESNVSKIRHARDDDMAEYLIAFDAQGVPQQEWLLDALPDVALGKELRAVAVHLRVNESSDAELRYALVPIAYSYGKYELRKK